MEIEKIIESILFWKGEPVSKKDLAKMVGKSEEEISVALLQLKNSLSGRGIILVDNGEDYSLATCKEASELIGKFEKEELERELSKAAMEVLAIVLYKAPVTKSYIDYVRGVNSQFTLRSLLIRGLIERKTGEGGEERGFVYYPSIDLLRHLGVADRGELPNFEEIKTKLETIEKESVEETQPEIKNNDGGTRE